MHRTSKAPQSGYRTSTPNPVALTTLVALMALCATAAVAADTAGSRHMFGPNGPGSRSTDRVEMRAARDLGQRLVRAARQWLAEQEVPAPAETCGQAATVAPVAVKPTAARDLDLRHGPCFHFVGIRLIDLPPPVAFT